MNFANVLTLSRFVLAPIIGFLYLSSAQEQWLPFVLFCVAAVSDSMDGYVARSMDIKSDLGRDLDPLADKFLTTFLYIMIVAKNGHNPWIVISGALIIVRDVLVTGLRSIVGSGHIPVTRTSKLKTFFQCLTIGIILFPFQRTSWKVCMDPSLFDVFLGTMMCLSAVLACLSAYDHIRRFVCLLSGGK